MRITSDIRDALFDIYGPKQNNRFQGHDSVEDQLSQIKQHASEDLSNLRSLAEAANNKELNLSRAKRRSIFEQEKILSFFIKYLGSLESELETARTLSVETYDARANQVAKELRKLKHVFPGLL